MIKYSDTPLIMHALLSTMSMLSSPELVMSCDMPVDCIAGLAGEEKEGMGSMPFSSLTPVSLSSTPVRLDNNHEHSVSGVSESTCDCSPSLTAKRCVVSRSPLFSWRLSWSHDFITLFALRTFNADLMKVNGVPRSNRCLTKQSCERKSSVTEKCASSS